MNALLEALSMLGNVVDTPGSMARGLLAGDPGAAFGGIMDPSRRMSGRGMLERWGALGENEEGLDLGDVLGFGAEVATDPLNLLGGGLLARTGAARGSAMANNARREAVLAAGGMPEEIAKLTKAVDEAGNPLKTFHGTPHVFDKYDMSKADPDALFGPGIYTTADPNIASEYAEKGATLPGDIEIQLKGGNKEIADVLRGTSLDNVPLSLTDPSKYQPGFPGYHDDTLGGMVRNWIKERLQRREAEPLDASENLLVNELLRNAMDVKALDPSPMNVRSQFLDVRNPFVVDKEHDLLSLPRNLQSQFLEDKMLDASKGFGDIEESPAYQAFRQAFPFDRASQQDLPSPPGKVEELLAMLGEANRNVRGEDVMRKINKNKYGHLQDSGYDAIRHEGGKRIGNVPHDVLIALDPSQVYSPWVAPGEKAVPSYSPLMAALAGHNLARGGSYLE